MSGLTSHKSPVLGTPPAGAIIAPLSALPHKQVTVRMQPNRQKKRIRFENTPRRSPTIHIWCQMYSVPYTIGNPEKRFLTQ